MSESVNRIISFFAGLGTIEYIIFLAIGAVLCYILHGLTPVVLLISTSISGTVYIKVEALAQNGIVAFIAALICWMVCVYIMWRGKRRADMLELYAMLHSDRNSNDAANIKSRSTTEHNDD